MENGIEYLNNFKDGVSPNELSPLVLAYIGDAVFEILVRQRVLSSGNAPVNVLHKKSKSIVNAKAQSDIYFKIKDSLTQQEEAVFRRGRNAKSHAAPKNAEVIDYKHATGLEALFGYLYLDGQYDRMKELFELGLM